MALRVTQAVDYAIRAMVYIGSFPEGRWVLRGEVARAEGMPASFTAKILRSLVQAGLLRSARGACGGFRLSRPAVEISLLQVFEALEGPIALTGNGRESRTDPVQSLWNDLERHIGETLEGTTLEALVSAPRRNGVVLFRPRARSRTAAEAS